MKQSRSLPPAIKPCAATLPTARTRVVNSVKFDLFRDIFPQIVLVEDEGAVDKAIELTESAHDALLNAGIIEEENQPI